MAQSSKPRHSKSTKKPVTIDLEAEAVKSESKPSDQDAKSPGAEAARDSETASAKTESKPATAGSSASAATASASTKAESPSEKPAADKPSSPTGPATKPDAPSAQASAGKPAQATGTGSKQGASSTESKPRDTATKAASTGPKIGAPSSEKPSGKSSGAPPSGSAPPQKPEKSGGMGALTAGLVGGIVVLVIGAGLIWSGVLPGFGGAQTGTPGSELEDLRQAISDFEDQANSQISDLATSMENRIADLQQGAGSSATGSSDQLQALQKQVADLSTRIESLGSGSDVSSVTTQLDSVAKTQEAQQTALQQIQNNTSSLAAKVNALEASQNQSIGTIDSRLKEIEQTLAGPREDVKVARALTAANLKSAIDRGGPFMAELEAFASVEGTSPTVDQLRSLAASGVPTQSQLLDQFSSQASAIIAAADGSPQDQGVWNRLLDSASSVIKVRPVGEVAGDTPEAIVARVENRLKTGDLQGAVNEWNTLPQGSKDASADFIKGLKARIQADQLLATMLSGAIPATASDTAASSAPATTGDAAPPDTATTGASGTSDASTTTGGTN